MGRARDVVLLSRADIINEQQAPRRSARRTTWGCPALRCPLSWVLLGILASAGRRVAVTVRRVVSSKRHALLGPYRRQEWQGLKDDYESVAKWMAA